ncbi:hypothetical protein D1007_44697 [Hordeum vulgare]|nr:hypothetical protein D1007_44697 [Hordeum vulgare]
MGRRKGDLGAAVVALVVTVVASVVVAAGAAAWCGCATTTKAAPPTLIHAMGRLTRRGGTQMRWSKEVHADLRSGATTATTPRSLEQQVEGNQAQDRRHPTPGKRNAAPLVGSAERCGAVINLRKWSESVGAKGILNIAWVNVSNIPLDKRHEKNIAYVGSLVGVTLEIDKATINRPKSVRIKLGCRDAENIPASTEGVLGGHFYDFFFSVDKILVKNPPKEKINVQMEADGGNSPKRTKFNENIRPDGQNVSSSTMGESTAPSGMSGGKNMMSVKLDTIQEKAERIQNQEKSEETQSDEESEDVHDMLLIDSMVAEVEESHMKEIEKQSTEGTSYEKIVVNSMQIVPNPVVHRKFSSYLDACVGEPTITEMKNDDKNYQKEGQTYFVQSPGGPVKMWMLCLLLLFWKNCRPDSARGLLGSIWNMLVPGLRRWQERGIYKKPELAEVMKKGAEMLKANASQMLLLCGPPMPEPSDQDEGNDN